MTDVEVVEQEPPVTRGNPDADVVVVCDSPSQEAWRMGVPMDPAHLRWLGELLINEYGFRGRDQDGGDFLFVGLCPPIPDHDKKSASRRWSHVEPRVEVIRALVDRARPRLVVTFGELATRAVLGRAVKITKVRGVPIVRDTGPTVLPMLSPAFIHRIPDHLPAFRADVNTLAMLRDADYDVSAVSRTETYYEWRTDISDFLEDRPPVITVDTEGTGLRWWDPAVVPITVQFSPEPGRSIVCPVDEEYWGQFAPGERGRLVHQLRELLEDPRVRKIGHNVKFDHAILRKLDIEVQGWLHDTQLMGFGADENMLKKSLDEMVRIWVAEMSGYADEFNESVDKSRMRDVPHDQMLPYAGGDSDATFRLARALQAELARDVRQQAVYRRIQFPAIMCFANVVERHGFRVDTARLTELTQELDAWTQAEKAALMRLVPSRLKRRHMNSGKDVTFTRPDFVRDLLFDQEAGFGLTPCVWTEGTQDLPVERRIPSTSAKDHMPYFVNDRRQIGRSGVTVGDFVTRLIEYQKTVKLSGTYVGLPSDPEKNGAPTGFWQYLSPWDRIYPSYMLHRTNTGRTASSDPNGQNWPKHGTWAKRYARIFRATPGYRYVAADLSQIELRVAAWMSMEPTMLAIFGEGGDIHAMTASTVLGVSYEQFRAWKRDERRLIEVANEIRGSGEYLRKLNPGRRQEVTVGDYYAQKRFEAKAVNFGFLYGMGWRKFMSYAKTDYGVDFTEEEAQHIRRTFFETYPGLVRWHETMKRFARENGYVRGLHGACRHLPSVGSNDEGIRAAAERYAVNSPVQRFGSDLGLIALIRFCHQADPERMRIIGFVHDQLIMEVRDDVTNDEAGGALKWAMENAPLREWFGIEPPLPILADVSVGDDAGSMEELDDVVARKPDWWDDDEEAAAARFLAVRRPAHPEFAEAA